MKLTERFHLVASGGNGMDLTDRLDCNVHVLTDGRRHHMFDSGAGLDVDGMLDAMQAGGLDPDGLETLFLTHAHADHSGGAAALKARVPGLRILSGAATAEILAQRDERAISLDRARGGYYPADYQWTPPEVDGVMQPDDPLEVGPYTVTLIETPGHSADHSAFLVTGQGAPALIAGDALFAGGRVVLQEIADCSVADSIASIRKLADLDWDEFYPGHGTFSLKDGRRHARRALDWVAMTGVPAPF